MIGGTGAVGGEVLDSLRNSQSIDRLTLLGRRKVDHLEFQNAEQHVVDVLNSETYQDLVSGHDVAICTLGVGQPSKVSREMFVKIDKDAVLEFARLCKASGVKHFHLLSSVGVDSQSSNFFLRTKGELEDGLKALQFDRLGLFHPSMILTPENRYGWVQGLTLVIWPLLKPLLSGPLRKFRGIRVEILGRAIAANVFGAGDGVEVFEWDEMQALADDH